VKGVAEPKQSNPKKPDADKKQIPLRLSPTLWEKISMWAEEDFRSINGQIEYILSEAVKAKYGKNRL